MNPSLSIQKQSRQSGFHLTSDVNMHSLSMYDEESYYHPTNDINCNNSNTASFSMNDNHLPFNIPSNDYSLSDNPIPIYSPPLLNCDKSPMIYYNESPQLLSLNNPLNSPQFNNYNNIHNNNFELKPFSLTPIPQDNSFFDSSYSTNYNNIITNDINMNMNMNMNINDIDNNNSDNISITNNGHLLLERSISSHSSTTISYNNSINNNNNHYSLSPQSPSLSSPKIINNSITAVDNNNTNMNTLICPNPNININNINNPIPHIPINMPINMPINNIIDNILMTPKRNNKKSDNFNEIIQLQTPPNIDICNISHISPLLIPSIPKLPCITHLLKEHKNNMINNNTNPSPLLPLNTSLNMDMNNISTDNSLLSVLNTSDNINVIPKSENENNIFIDMKPIIKSIKPIKPEFNYITTNNINITPIPLPLITTIPKPIKNKIKKIITKTKLKKQKQKRKTQQITKTNIKTPNSKSINKKLKQTKTIKKNQNKIKEQKKLYENCNNLNQNLNTNTKQKSEEIRRIKNPKTRRKHTAIACIKCWKAKTRCSIKRPCDRCVRIGCQDQCVDRPPSSRKRQNVTKVNGKNVKRKITIKKNCTEYNQNHIKCCSIRTPMPPPKPKQPICITTPIPIPIPPPTPIKTQRRSKRSMLLSDVSSEKPFSVATTSLSAIMSSFKKNKLKSLFPIPILESDPSFIYLPVLSGYQILEKQYCKKCAGLLETFDSNCVDTHLQTPHNYKCPNKNCEREFVLQHHLGIHLKICKESQKLNINVKKVLENEYKIFINYVIKSPIDNYYTNVNEYDVRPTNKWIQQQLKGKEKKMKTKQKRKNNNKQNNNRQPPIKKRKINPYK